jgi:acyl-coenzyme A synthetase/AMP-(fatty) acid ligase
MHKNKITVSCFTPAMGQLLTTVAQPGFLLEAFRMAFFVGDVLIKRDIARLKALAPHVTVVNMYGSTESQRSVGHFVVQANAPKHIRLSLFSSSHQCASRWLAGRTSICCRHRRRSFRAAKA